jgi:large subunit ribosomal protein L35
MPKLKSNRGAAKRFKRTGKGGVQRSKAYASHILTKKNSKRKMNLRQGAMVDKANIVAVKRLLPYL